MKGQAAFELMIIFGFLIAISAFLVLSYQRQFDTQIIQTKLDIMCYELATKIDYAYIFGIGFKQDMFLPSKLNGNDYSILVDKSLIFCSSGKKNSIQSYNANITSSGLNPPFNIPLRQITIKNVNGTVEIL